MRDDLDARLSELEEALGVKETVKSSDNLISIMVVDDDPDYLDAMVDSLKPDFNVISCKSGIEALSRLTEETCAIILDIKMPGLDGLDVLGRIQEQGLDIPVILNTGYSGEYLEHDIRTRHKPFGYVTKDNPLVLQTNLITSVKLMASRKDIGENPDSMNALMTRKAPEKRTSENLEALSASRPIPPFRLDWIEPRYIDANGRSFFMSNRIHDVLRAMMSKEPGLGGVIRGGISDAAVAMLYTGNDISDPEDAKRISMNFRANLRKAFAEQGIIDKNAVIKRSKTFGGYVMGNAWHPKKPLINKSEVNLSYRDISESDLVSHQPDPYEINEN